MSNYAVKSYDSSKGATQFIPSQDFFYYCKTQLKENLQKVETIFREVPLPRGKMEYIGYFCGRSGSAVELNATKTKRSGLLKAINELVISYINIMGWSKSDSNDFNDNSLSELEKTINNYVSIRESIYSNVLLQNHLINERIQLDAALKELDLLCSKVEFPKNELNYIHFFCGKSGTLQELLLTENKRKTLYKHTASLLRFYIGIADEMEAAGYTTDAKESVINRVDYYIQLRDTVRCSVLLQTRLVKARAELDSALERVRSLCIKVNFPKDELEHILYFCGKRGDTEDLKLRKILRNNFNKAVIDLSCAYTILAEEMEAAGYSLNQLEKIESSVKFYSDVRFQMIRYESYDCNHV